jgi:FkbM family methyltransferase
MKELAMRWHDRLRYPRKRDWLWSLYDRLLNSRPGKILPLRGRTRMIRVAGIDKPFALRLGTSDWAVLKELMLEGGYDAIIRANLSAIENIIDLGANVGMSCRLWQKHFPSARVLAVEPDPGNLAACRRNLDAGGDTSHFMLVGACAAATPGEVYLDHRGGDWAITMERTPAPGRTPVRAMTMPQLLELAGMTSVDLLKCDIEGAERELFADCRAWINLIRNMVVELHAPYTPALFRADLERNGGRFDIQILGEAGPWAILLLKKQ